MEVLDQELAQADAQFEALIADDPIVKRLTTCPSIGAITAASGTGSMRTVGRTCDAPTPDETPGASRGVRRWRAFGFVLD
jgi:hypothetical protein